jgi:hypothetical protein
MSAAPATPVAADPNATGLQAAASIPVNLPAQSAAPNTAALANAASIPVSPAVTGGDTVALNAAASIPVNLPAASRPPVEHDPWEQPPAVATAQDEDGPWMAYRLARTAVPSAVERDPWEQPAAQDDGPSMAYRAAAAPQPVATAQNGPRAFGQASNLDDPYANSSLADSAAAIGRTADNAVRNAANRMTLGYGDKGAAALDAATGRAPDYATALNQEQAQSARAMAASPGGVVTGEQLIGAALPAGAIAKGAAAIGDAAAAVPYLGRIAASPFAQATATGATVGGVNAAGTGQDPVTGAILGAGAGAAGSTIARGVGALARAATPSAAAAAPSTQDIKDAAQAAYGAAFQPGHVIAPESLQRLSDAIKTTMAANAFDPALHPGGMAVVNRIAAFPAPGGSASSGGLANAGATLQGLDTLRRVTGLMGEGGPSAGRLGGLVQGQIDQFVNGLSPADIVGASNPAAAATSLNNARAAWQTYSKAADLDSAVQAARAKGDMALIPGSTIDRATRQAVANLRDSRASWSPDELAALNEVAKGSPTQRALRMVGALAPTNPIAAAVHLTAGVPGAMATGGLSALAQGAGMAAGFGAKAAANKLTANAVNNLGALIRSGGSAAPMAAPSAFPRVASPLSAALVNSLFAPGPQPYGLGAAFAQ